MNERVKELAEQVGAVQNVLAMGRHDGVLFTETELEKFAELIVQKCADIGQQYADGNYEVYNQILEHFGIEEK